jgi:hypothetical protein
MPRVRSAGEIARIRHQVKAEQAALYPDYDITIAVSKMSPPPNDGADYVITRCPKSWSD